MSKSDTWAGFALIAGLASPIAVIGAFGDSIDSALTEAPEREERKAPELSTLLGSDKVIAVCTGRNGLCDAAALLNAMRRASPGSPPQKIGGFELEWSAFDSGLVDVYKREGGGDRRKVGSLRVADEVTAGFRFERLWTADGGLAGFVDAVTSEYARRHGDGQATARNAEAGR